jgi:hypothetical protein
VNELYVIHKNLQMYHEQMALILKTSNVPNAAYCKLGIEAAKLERRATEILWWFADLKDVVPPRI